MKLEKINENQIRCTLTREDLEMHQVNLRGTGLRIRESQETFPRYDAAGADRLWF